jgi:isoleucyl-tRNA synthetase
MNPIPKIEKKILKFWQKEDIFAKSIKLRQKKPFFSFYDGPPFASGLPHYGNILAGTIKDTVLRYWAMKGHRIGWRVGWDCHGLPVENMIEQKLGLKSKKEIEKFGIKKFNQACRQSVFQCINDWYKTFNRVARWADFSQSYATLDNEYIESVWWVLKQLWEQGLVYQDFRVTPYCPRCGTPLSNFELNQPGAYQEVEDESVYIKFPLKGQPDTFLFVWTTTPWTLAANTAVAVGPDFKYLKVKFNNQYYILAKERLDVLTKAGKCEVVEELFGRDLVGLEYQPLYPMKLDKPGYRIVPADFVSVEDGTGLVHIAPTFGEEDMELGQKEDLPGLITVDEEGKVIKGLKIPGEGKFVKKADQDIKADLKKRDLLFKAEKIKHAYPFCWRCESPLLYYPINSWYVAVTKFKKELVANNQKIRWVPGHLKKGRFGKWLEGARDWSISRNRYWGTPIPIWQCSKCGRTEVIGGLDELAQKAKRNNYYILRHGQTKFNIDYQIYTDTENRKMPLTGKGENEIRSLVPELKKAKIDLIFSSDFFRTRQTASIIGQALGIKVIQDRRLRDIEMGKFKGRPLKEYFAYFQNDNLKRFEQAPPGGENLSQVKKRMMSFLLATDKKYRNKNILIVGHGGPLWILKGASRGLSNEEIANNREKELVQVGQLSSLKFKKLPFDDQGNLNLHRPFVDQIEIPCSCGGTMKRTSEVFDCWFESGSMPYGQWHYPFQNKELVEKTFPADFIAEGIDQTRGWFYTLHVLASALTLKNLGLGKNQPAFKNVIVNGLVLGEDGKKLSKRLKNYPAPEAIFDKYGADAIRYYLLTGTPMGEDYIVSEKRIAETFRRTIMTFYNSFTFLDTYTDGECLAPKSVKPKNALDRWIISLFNTLNQEMVEWMDKYELTKAARLLDDFLEDFSNWYVRRSRRLFQRPINLSEKKEAQKVYSFVLLRLAKLAAPFLPFLTEEIYQHLEKGSSVHLADYPKSDKKLIDKKLEAKMSELRQIAAVGLAQRAKAGLKVRQPLEKLTISSKPIATDKGMANLLAEEVNVKEVVFGKEIKLDTKISPKLRAEGIVRDLIRFVQGMRKDGGLKPGDKIYLRYSSSPSLRNLIQKNESVIRAEVSANRIEATTKRKETFLVEKEVKLDGQKIWLGIRKR